MAVPTADILDILRAHDINPEEDPQRPDFPEIGRVEEGETIYTTSLDVVEHENDNLDSGVFESTNDPRLEEWWRDVGGILDRGMSFGPDPPSLGQQGAPEPRCAWYSPIHYFGHGWGIYIREECILHEAAVIAQFIDWRGVPWRPRRMVRHLLRSAFYSFFLHEQFHHKVESLGFRLLIATASGRYRRYKRNVYRAYYASKDCLEESLANAESYRRLNEQRYAGRLDKHVRAGLRSYLRASFRVQPPGYAEAIGYLTNADFRSGQFKLQSQMLDGSVMPSTPAGHWMIAPNMITALTDITDDIYVILPHKATPLFRPSTVDPGVTVSSRVLIGALKKHHGYAETTGGKGSHVKLVKDGCKPIVIPGGEPVLSPGVLKHALEVVMGKRMPNTRVTDLIKGTLLVDAVSGNAH